MDINIMLAIVLIWSLISANFKGILYDDQRKKLDPGYKGNHSFRSSFKYILTIPIPIENKRFKQELKIVTNKYNIVAYAFWICLIVLLVANCCK